MMFSISLFILSSSMGTSIASITKFGSRFGFYYFKKKHQPNVCRAKNFLRQQFLLPLSFTFYWFFFWNNNSTVQIQETIHFLHSEPGRLIHFDIKVSPVFNLVYLPNALSITIFPQKSSKVFIYKTHTFTHVILFFTSPITGGVVKSWDLQKNQISFLEILFVHVYKVYVHFLKKIWWILIF